MKSVRNLLWVWFGVEKYFVHGLVVAGIVMIVGIYAVRAVFSWLGGA